MSDAALAWLIWLVALAILLYLAREPAHRAILGFSRLLYRGTRVAAASLIRAQKTLRQRNREVLLAAGRDASERMIEREFQRIDAAVHRDLASCPGLHRKMNEEFERIVEEYRRSTDVPPKPSGWVEAVNAVAHLPSDGNPMVTNVLKSIHEALVKAQDKAIEEYRAASQTRHRHLQSITPHVGKLLQLLGAVDTRVKGLLRRTEIVDRQIEEYEGILKETDAAIRWLSSSSLIQFFISAFVLAVAVGGAAINFHLIARPMGEMVGGNSMIGSFKTSDIAALVIILVEISMGLFLMESLRITRLFPVIGALPDKTRIRMIWVTFGILFALASVEAGLSYMREILLQDELATAALLRGETGNTFDTQFVWITTAAQMGMGFVLPFALVFVAIPLETFVHSLRTVLGLAGIGLLQVLAAVLRLLGGLVRHGAMLIELYDLLIFAPLWLERQVKTHLGGERKPAETATMKEMSP
ncbi:MAG: hypothetical protein ACE5GS_11520 [Kiloniellaceae bacterium]